MLDMCQMYMAGSLSEKISTPAQVATMSKLCDAVFKMMSDAVYADINRPKAGTSPVTSTLLRSMDTKNQLYQ